MKNKKFFPFLIKLKKIYSFIKIITNDGLHHLNLLLNRNNVYDPKDILQRININYNFRGAIKVNFRYNGISFK